VQDKDIKPLVDKIHADFPEFTYSVTFTTLYEGDFYIVKVLVRWGDTSLPAAERDSDSFETIVRRKNF
jgi:hypothetical protein